MSIWDGKQILRWGPEPWDGYPGWYATDCGCCNGLEWSAGYEPIECDSCNGTGSRAVHLASGTVALYPGGPLLGARLQPAARERLALVVAAEVLS